MPDLTSFQFHPPGSTASAGEGDGHSRSCVVPEDDGSLASSYYTVHMDHLSGCVNLPLQADRPVQMVRGTTICSRAPVFVLIRKLP